jgi:hypothetical protein
VNERYQGHEPSWRSKDPKRLGLSMDDVRDFLLSFRFHMDAMLLQREGHGTHGYARHVTAWAAE